MPSIASRLARNGRDWLHLVDLCALAGALVIDPDGACDPRRVNDRLLLGLNGTISEYELGLLRQRGIAAMRSMRLAPPASIRLPARMTGATSGGRS
ncbi:recombinase family protein [Bradyrhizobium sp. DN5]|uniref:recombinase family protein n=1 Tax=Bradyrhizobium sp. DN5 TaxID=3056950 RepID=UPI003525E62C